MRAHRRLVQGARYDADDLGGYGRGALLCHGTWSARNADREGESASVRCGVLLGDCVSGVAVVFVVVVVEVLDARGQVVERLF